MKVTPAYGRIASAKFRYITVCLQVESFLVNLCAAEAARSRFAHMANRRPSWTALAECAGVISRYWITVGIPYVIFF